jgi:hypothetical protein
VWFPPRNPSVEKLLALCLAPGGRDRRAWLISFAMNGHRIVPALSFTNQSLAITTVVQELLNFGRSRLAAIRISRLGRSPRIIGQ